MFDYLYEWVRNVACYLVLVTAVMQVLPNKDYEKYIHFFTGLVLVLMLLTPILKIFGNEDIFSKIYNQDTYEEQMQQFRKMQEDILQTEKEQEEIEVGEIEID